MNKNKTQSKEKAKKPSEGPQSVVASEPVEANHYDQRYIEAYTDNPKAGKKQALITAGYCGEFASQEAWRIHNRVRDGIEKRLKSNMADLANLAYTQLKDMLTKDATEVGYSNMSTAIKAGFDYSGHKPSEKLEIIEKELTYEELQQAVAENERQLNEQTH